MLQSIVFIITDLLFIVEHGIGEFEKAVPYLIMRFLSNTINK